MEKGVAEVLNRIRQPFNVNTLAQVAACAAIEDESFMLDSVGKIHDGIDFIVSHLSEMGLTTLSTQSNFLMLDIQTEASIVFEKMLYEGIVVRSHEILWV